MLTTYLIVTVLAAAANLFSATCDFVRYKKVSIAMAKAGVPESWMTVLGILKAAGALGLLIGFRVPLIGTAAAIGLILFFVGAIITHLRAHDYSFGLAVAFLLLAVAALVLRLVSP
jgi:DoxX-like family